MNTERILSVGEYYKDNGSGGIVSVLRCYAAQMQPFRFVASSRGNSFINKIRYDLFGLVEMLFKLPGTDIVHIHTAGRGSFRKHQWYLRLARLAGKKTILHMHSAEFRQYFHDEASPRIRKSILRSLNGVDMLIVLSQAWKDWYESIGVHSRIEILNNIVPAVSNAGSKSGRGILRLLFLGEIGPRKGIFDVIEALASQKAGFEGKLHLDIGGNGEDARLEREIAGRRLDAMVTFHGYVSGEKKEELLAKADAVILPSYNEGLPISLLEGMSHGCAIISSPVGGIPEIIDDSNGILVAPGDVPAIAAAIESFLGSDLAPLKQASLAKVRAFYPDAVLSRLQTLYSSL